jgi:hypothetical protein
MRILAIILFVFAVVSLFSGNPQAPVGSDPEFAKGHAIGTLILPVVFAVAGAWCFWKGMRNAKNKRQQVQMAQE